MEQYKLMRGATRPPLFLGVPLVPFVLLGVSTMVPVGWCVVFQAFIPAIALSLIGITLFLGMRHITRQDPWRTRQFLMRLKMRRIQGNYAQWGAISHSPFTYVQRGKLP